MKYSVQRITVAGLVGQRLAALGAGNIPVGARELIEANVTQAVVALVKRFITAPVVGRAVANALAAPAGAGEGSKGAQAPLASSLGRTPSAQPDVTGHTTDNQAVLPGDTSKGATEPPTGGDL